MKEVGNWTGAYILKLQGQIILKGYFVSSISSKKWTKTRRLVVKTNSFVRFLEESMDCQFAFEINWPLWYEFCHLHACYSEAAIFMRVFWSLVSVLKYGTLTKGVGFWFPFV